MLRAISPPRTASTREARLSIMIKSLPAALILVKGIHLHGFLLTARVNYLF